MVCEHKKTQTLVGDNDTERVVCCDCGETLAESKVESEESVRITQLESKVRQLEEDLKAFRGYVSKGLVPFINGEFSKAYKRHKALDKSVDVCFKNDKNIREYINHTLLPNVKLKGWFF